MFSLITEAVIKKTAKTVAAGVLEGVSFLGDKVAEYADEGAEWVESLDKKDTTAREERKEKREKKTNV